VGGGGRKNKKEGKKEEKEEKKGEMVLQIRLVFATEKKILLRSPTWAFPPDPPGPDGRRRVPVTGLRGDFLWE